MLLALQVREFLLQKLYTLKRPKTNIQIIQQNVLLKYKYFIRFLRQHGKEIYDEVRATWGCKEHAHFLACSCTLPGPAR